MKSSKLIILVAEDDPASFSLTRKRLVRAGIEASIIHFVDGQALVDFLLASYLLDCRHNCNFLIILDLDMPRLNGMDVLRHIKSSRKLADLPVVVLSCYEDRKTIDSCYRLNAQAFFAKPLDAERFRRFAEKLGRPSTAERSPSSTVSGGP